MCTRACHRHKHVATEVPFVAALIKRTSELTANAGEGMRERFQPQETYVLYIRSMFTCTLLSVTLQTDKTQRLGG